VSESKRPFLFTFPIVRAVAAQLVGGIATVIAMALLRNAGWPAHPATLCVIWGAAAALATIPMKLRPWWLPVQAAAPVLMWVVLGLQPPGWVFPAVFVVLLALYWNAVGEGVPLYLSNAKTWRALADLLPKRDGIRVADLGSGLGGTLWHLAEARPDALFEGFETAPLVYLFTKLRKLVQPRANIGINFLSLWRADLGDYDVIYCFLSPVPMERLYAKATREMKPGSLFISNSFEVPDVDPDEIVHVDDRRRTRLLIYRM
jgi:SAM-dependent methyltransferase